MALGKGAGLQRGKVSVVTTQEEGLPLEYWVERLMEKMLSVSETTAEPLKLQAQAFKREIAVLALHHMKNAINSDRATIAGLLRRQGHGDIADQIRRL